jgi:hypothetical protein
VVKLNRDMTSLGSFADGSTFKEITPSGYVEGALMFKRKGVYYLMWSEGGWTGPDYRVSYAKASSPVGPFPKLGTILSQNAAIATGSGHNTVINVPGSDDWYIFYHRHPLGDGDGNHRVLSYDRLVFAADGTIVPVDMQTRDGFCDGNALGWTAHGGSWSVADGRYRSAAAPESKSTLNDNYFVLAYDVDVTLDGSGDAGVLVRGAILGDGPGQYRGYTVVADSARGRLVLAKSSGSATTELASAPAVIAPGSSHHLRVVANYHRLEAWLDGAATPTLSASDGDFDGGVTGLIAHGDAARFDNVAITDPPGAIFYQDGGFGGPGVALPAGSYTLAQLAAAGIPNDWMSALRVPANLTVEVYADEGFAGSKWTFTADSSLVPADCNDAMSSVKILPR